MHKLCSVNEVKENRTKGFDLEVDGKIISLFVVYHEGKILAYKNSCPHVGTPLNWVPDRFMDSEGQFLQCATHGAMFRVDDGYCEFGPCAGESLTPETIVIENDDIYLE